MEEKPQPWGRLHKKQAILRSDQRKLLLHGGADRTFFDIYGPRLNFGRDHKCEYVIDKDCGLEDIAFQRISKVHFVLYKDTTSDGTTIYIKDLSRNGTFINKERIGRNQTRLIKDGDVISIIEDFLEIFNFKDLTPPTTVDLPAEVQNKYFVGEKLGSGAFGVVYKAFDRKATPYAIKYVKGSSMVSKPKSGALDNEISIMKKLKHVCIINTIDIMKSHTGACLVLEYMDGGDLLNRIINSPEKRLTEEQSRCIFFQITEAINYLHKKGITHRDIKPDNVLLKDHDEYTLVKLTDFGLSKLVVDGTYMKSVLGTPTYTAPEVLMDAGTRYTSKVDVWSMGVTLFATISGTLPFAEEYGNVHIQITSGRYCFLAQCWKDVSSSAIRLIKKMLLVQPEARIDVAAILEASWLDPKHVGVEIARKIMERNGGRITRLPTRLKRMQINAESEFAFPTPPAKRARLDR